MKMKETFSCHSGLTFEVKVRLAPLVNIFEGGNSNGDEKNFQLSFCVYFQSERRNASSNEPFVKSRFNENERNFQPSF